ncbi:hypothetical protein QWY31_13245 [Cytophagales bacterium LB-30]|uniref:Uncharacterized protein n=1 Tax=Shiella aurantiaca TaxID=3058365 RepID=A0ABT8F8A0_9BACT|nr:hypothetical protein [Shiella aurantiaca]MDN4166469.1 hypothetical protein [Shiella aurantiaca]
MSHQPIDQLFSKKLKSLEQAPSLEAWDRLAQQLEQKEKAIFWTKIRVAASVAILLVSGSIVYLQWNTQTASPIAQNDATEVLVKDTAIEKDAQALSDTSKEEKPSTSPALLPAEKPARVAQVEKKTEKRVSQPQPTKKEELPKSLKVESTEMLALHTAVQETTNKATAVQPTEETLPPVTIIYKPAPSTSSTQALANNSAEEEDKSGWGAVLTVAKDFKDGNITLTSKLKEAKEELFALNLNKKNKNNAK